MGDNAMDTQYCKTCACVAHKLEKLLPGSHIQCPITSMIVYTSSIACSQHVKYVNPHRKCDNCRYFKEIKKGVRECFKKQFPQTNGKIRFYTSCNQFSPRTLQIANYIIDYWEKRTAMAEMQLLPLVPDDE